MLTLSFGIQLLFVSILLFLSMRFALRRYPWTPVMAWINGASVAGFYVFLSYLLQGKPWVQAYLTPAGIVLISIGLTLVLSEHFWRRLSQVQTQLIQSEKMASLGQLVAGVAHDLNTPLGALQSNYDLFGRAFRKLRRQIEDGAMDEKAGKLLENLDELNEVNRAACHRMCGIVDSLRSFARLDQAEFQRTDIHEGIETTLTLLNYLIKDRIRIVKDFGEIPAVDCYPNQLNQVFMNILVNAAQAIEKEGEIRIRTRRQGSDIIVQISDTGIGISAENQKRIFDPGFTTKGVKVGMGLGLPICYQIIREHGGKIGVESQDGAGTTVTLSLPIKSAPVPATGRKTQGIAHGRS